MRSAVLGPGTATGDGDLGVSVTGASSFGEDALCRLYVASSASGVVYRLEARTPAQPGCQTVPGPPGPGPTFDPPVSSSPPTGSPRATLDAPVDATAPVLADVGLTRSRFAVASAASPLVATVRGTTFRFTLSEPATVRIEMGLRLSGRRAAGRCRPASRRLRSRPRCTRYVSQGSLVRGRSAGPGSIAFSGRLGRRPLRAGSYRATLTATDAAGNVSRLRRLQFRVTVR